jgi:VanZ family protein
MFFKYNLYTLIWAVIILLLVLMPGAQMAKADVVFSFDKIAHGFVFCVLVFLMIVGFAKQNTFTPLRSHPVKYALLISIAYALILEAGQLLVSGRMVEVYDAVANVSGCLVGYGIFYVVYKL